MIRRYGHVQLLVTLSALLLVNPFLQRTLVFALVDLLLMATLVSAVIACANRRSQAIVGFALAALVLGSVWYRDFTGDEGVTVLHSILALCFFGYVTALVLRDVFRETDAVSADTICGALSAYLLLGVGWAFAYSLLEALLPGSLHGLRTDDVAQGYAQYLGYSFVTLTTLGYGNVVPANARAESLAVAEAVVGQVYLTVLVARLVALNLASAQRRTSDRDPD